MDRKWRLNRNAINTVLSFPAFCDTITPLKEGYALASLTDLYAVYTVLHIESKEWEVRWSPEGEFYYFIAKQTITKKQQAAVPEGDEDMPAPLPEGEAEQGENDGESNRIADFLNRMENAEYSGEEEEEEDYFEEDEEEETAVEVEEEIAEEEPKAAEPQEPEEPKIRTQLLVPVSSSYAKLTPELLQRFFLVRGVQVQQMILGLVDSNGVVTRCCLYNYIQAPLEGPGTANLELLDD